MATDNTEAGARLAETPAAKWREEGRPDPHGDRYDCERSELAMGYLTDDEMANAVYLHGDSGPSVAALMSGALPGSAYLVAAKDRIRWLSRRLEAAESHARALLAASEVRNG
jgi:hypothetical protein